MGIEPKETMFCLPETAINVLKSMLNDLKPLTSYCETCRGRDIIDPGIGDDGSDDLGVLPRTYF